LLAAGTSAAATPGIAPRPDINSAPIPAARKSFDPGARRLFIDNGLLFNFPPFVLPAT